MQKSKEIATQNPYLVTRVSLIDSIRNIPRGKTATFHCLTAGPLTSAKSCVSRLNKAAGREEYIAISSDNGITYTVTHL